MVYFFRHHQFQRLCHDFYTGITVNASLTEDAVYGFCAAYDENGKMLAVESMDENTKSLTLEFSNPAEAVEVRIFSLNDNYAPIAGAQVLPIVFP